MTDISGFVPSAGGRGGPGRLVLPAACNLFSLALVRSPTQSLFSFSAAAMITTLESGSLLPISQGYAFFFGSSASSLIVYSAKSSTPEGLAS